MRLAAILSLLALATLGECQLTFTREQFDQLDTALAAKRDVTTATPDDFAWSDGYILRGYVEMYEATGDRDYLRRLVKLADAIVETRDDRRAAHEGKTARPLWSIAGKYTQARLTLKDTQGQAAIGLRSVRYAYNDQTLVTLQPGAQPGSFSLTTSNAFWKKHLDSDVTFTDLSLDPASPRYFERVLNEARFVPEVNFQRDPDSKPSVLLVAADLRAQKTATTTLAPVEKAALVPALVPYYGYTGPIFAPLTRFAKLVLDDRKLQEEFRPAAERYIKAAAESVAAWQQCWHDGPQPNEGTYLLLDKGAEFWCDGIMAPWNYMGATGQVLCNLHDWTGDPQYDERITRLATAFKRACQRQPDGSYVWPYWSFVGAAGWTKPQGLSLNTPEYAPNPKAEDLSHGALEVEFAVMCAERGIVFNEDDMRAFAKTFVRLWNPETKTLARDVDGSGKADEGYAVAGARWLGLARWDARVWDINRAIWAGFTRPGAYGHALGNYARMYRCQQAQAKPAP